MTKPQPQDTPSGVNLTKALEDHGTGDLQEAWAAVRTLEAKLDAAREHLFRLRYLVHNLHIPTVAPAVKTGSKDIAPVPLAEPEAP